MQAPYLLVCIGVRVILLLGDFLSLQLSANHAADIERKLNGGEIPEQLCSSHRPIDHRRKLYPFTTATEEGCADKGHEIKKEKVPKRHATR